MPAPPPTQANKRMRGPQAGAGRTPITNAITWTRYQEKFFPDVNDPEEIKKQMPKDHILKDPKDHQHPPFDEVHACPHQRRRSAACASC